MRKHPILLLSAVFVAWIIGASLMLAGCASMTPMEKVEFGLQAAGMTRDAYCGLTEEGRAELRDSLHLPHLIRCAGDSDE